MASQGVKRIIPLFDRVLVEKFVPKKQSAGGVLLPDSAISKRNEGIIVAVGEGAKTKDGKVVPPSLKQGDRVLLPEYGETNIKIDDKELFLYREDDILAKLE